MKLKGLVYLVGAGPGDAGLLTLRGAELLQRADVVIYDLLVNPALLRFTRPDAERISRGRRTEFSQEQINDLLVAKAREGKIVVRLKGGDPYIFGRGAEEIETLAAAKIPFEVVPGVSSVIAAPAYAGIPITHRDHCSSFTVFTGHSDSANAATALHYEQIAKIPGTKIVLMGTENLDDWTKALVSHGMSPETPVAVVQWGTRGKQKSAIGTLATIAAAVKQKKMSPPALAVIGNVVKLRDKLNWFEHRPLFGQRVVVTRARGQASGFLEKLSGLGAEVLEVPAIKTVEPTRREDIVDALLSLNSYDWLVFTSVNGVATFFELFFRRFQDLRDIGGAKIAAVGSATADRLRALHLQVDVIPSDYVGHKIAEAMAKESSLENARVCLLRAEVASPDLPRALEQQGAIVDDIGIYKTVAETENHFGAADDLTEHGADWVTFTSGSTVEFFHARFNLPKLLKRFPQLKIASIGPETSKAIRALKLEPTVEAREHTSAGLLAAMLGHVAG
ncbi:MAG TPA: uroporphyrinogen-III C-methyltransferase [Desulfuromonadaceae bacterium]|nr:uroporphyrinogen-III C-methyltransferase [Desulfuromonadaceae bacterium]